MSCSPASAYSLSLVSGRALVVAAPGEVNAFVVEDLAGGVILTDAAQNRVSSPIPPGCVSGVAWEVVCDPGAIAAVSVDGADQNDSLANSSVLARVALAGGSGDDQIFGGSAGETLAGDVGNDTIVGGSGADVIDGGDGADRLIGADGDDTLHGGGGDDRLDGSDGSDVSDGGAGSDALTGGDGNDRLSGVDGNDLLSGDDGADDLAGGAGDDKLDGGRDADVIDGGDGVDELIGGEGSDELAGQAGVDSVEGGEGADHLDGGLDGDSLNGGAGDDRLEGAGGDDALIGAEGADQLSGGLGGDVVSYANQSAALQVTIDDLADDGGAGERDNVRADVEHVVGGSGPDNLTGSSRGDRLDGGGGDDLLDGRGGPDQLIGGEGTDTVTYASRAARVVARIAAGSSGESGEGDAIDASVENLIGGAGPDRLNGAAGVVNVLVGGGGRDVLVSRDDGGEVDRVVCGTGADRASIDRRDVAAADCERVLADGRQVRPPPKPEVFVGARRLVVDASGRTVISLQCAAATDRVCAGTVLITSRRQAGPVLGRGRFRVAPRATENPRIRLSPRLANAVRRAGRGRVGAWLRISVHDAAGRTSTRAVPVTLRAAPRP